MNYNNCISNNVTDGLRPYEKCQQLGADYLTDAELLAVILKTGVKGMSATELTFEIFKLCDDYSSPVYNDEDREMQGKLSQLHKLSLTELMKIRGVGRVKAIQIRCICELARRIAKQTAVVKLDFSNPYTVAQYYMQDLRGLDKEHLILVMLDSKCAMIKDMVLSVGTVNASLVNPREIFIEALRHNAVSVILLHNHPSGDAAPSRNDILVTKRIKSAGELIGIELIDHIIIGDNKYTSLKEKEFI